MTSKSLGWLAFILTLGGLLRGYGLMHGLPHVYYSDECHHVFWAADMAGGDLNPHQFLHPSLYLYLSLAAYAAGACGAVLLGKIDSLSDFWSLYQNHPEFFYGLSRGLSWIAGVASLYLTYDIGRRLQNIQAGLAAAFFLSCAYLHVLFSQIAYIDAVMVFFILGAVALSLRAEASPSSTRFLWAGVFSGLAFACKYSALPVFLLGPAAATAVWIARRGSSAEALRWTVLFFAGAAVGFTAGTPYWILDFKTFSYDFYRVFFAYQPGQGLQQLGFSGRWNWGYYLLNPLRYAHGLPLEVLGGAGLLWLGVRQRRLTFLIFPSVYFILTGLVQIRVARYALPLVPFFCIGAAFAVEAILRRLVDRPVKLAAGLRAAVLGGFCFAVAYPALLSSLKFSELKRHPDTRQQAAEWMLKNIPPGSAVTISAYSFTGLLNPKWKVGEFDRTVFDIRGGHVSSLTSLEQIRSEGYRYLILDQWHVDSILKGSAGSPHFEPLRQKYREFMAALEREAVVEADYSPYASGVEVPFSMEDVEFPSLDLNSREKLGPRVRIFKI